MTGTSRIPEQAIAVNIEDAVFTVQCKYSVAWWFLYSSDADLAHPLLTAVRERGHAGLPTCLLTIKTADNPWFNGQYSKTLPALVGFCGAEAYIGVHKAEDFEFAFETLVANAVEIRRFLNAAPKNEAP